MPHATRLANDRAPAPYLLGYPLLLGILLAAPLAKAGGTHGQHAAAMGHPAEAAQATRTVELSMDDRMRFSKPEIQIKRGETVRFVLHNQGRLKHEMVLGTDKEIKEHAKLMAKFPNMEHEDANSASVAPSAQGEITWKFTRNGTFSYACLLPGHYEAGMHGRIVVR